MARPIVATVDLAAIAANVAQVRRYAPGTEVMAVVKANAYGHGLLRVLPALADADGLALIELDAALALRAAGYRRPIVLLEGFFENRELEPIGREAIGVVVHDEAQVGQLEGARMERPIDMYVKANTGMNRLGFAPEQVAAICSRLAGAASIASVRLMTHFARADEDDGIAEAKQRFERATRQLAYRRSLANSAGVVRYSEIGGDGVRPGIMLYGATPFASRSASSLGLAPAMTLTSKLIAVQTLAPGDGVGYGGTFHAPRAMRVGVVACGYADGYPRHAPNGTPVLVGSRRVPMAGRVSMDMLTVDLTGVPDAQVGTDVVLWGEGLPVDDVAMAASTVGYELLCAVAPRVPFAVRER
ncbi:MAG TPA: alanine racemase [Casimicrobiaceae bacterium]|nr:alanine racemase [Casimicrobiaceae bacterium]